METIKQFRNGRPLLQLAHERMKRAIVEATDTSTVITGRRFGPVRILKNKLNVFSTKRTIAERAI